MVLQDFINKNISGKTGVDHLIEFIGRGLGALVAKIHSKHMVHGDLTTSNIMLKANSDEVPEGDEGKGNCWPTYF